MQRYKTVSPLRKVESSFTKAGSGHTTCWRALCRRDAFLIRGVDLTGLCWVPWVTHGLSRWWSPRCLSARHKGYPCECLVQLLAQHCLLCTAAAPLVLQPWNKVLCAGEKNLIRLKEQTETRLIDITEVN